MDTTQGQSTVEIKLSEASSDIGAVFRHDMCDYNFLADLNGV